MNCFAETIYLPLFILVLHFVYPFGVLWSVLPVRQPSRVANSLLFAISISQIANSPSWSSPLTERFCDVRGPQLIKIDCPSCHRHWPFWNLNKEVLSGGLCFLPTKKRLPKNHFIESEFALRMITGCPWHLTARVRAMYFRCYLSNTPGYLRNHTEFNLKAVS